MSDARSSTGILVYRALLASPTVFVVVAEITSVGSLGKSRNKKETSTHNEGVESSVLGILRQKDPTIKVNLIGDASQAAINADLDGNVKNQWKIAFPPIASPSGTTIIGPARVQSFDLDDAPVDGVQGATITLAWAGLATWTLA